MVESHFTHKKHIKIDMMKIKRLFFIPLAAASHNYTVNLDALQPSDKNQVWLLNLAINDTVTITAEENRTTGFMW